MKIDSYNNGSLFLCSCCVGSYILFYASDVNLDFVFFFFKKNSLNVFMSSLEKSMKNYCLCLP